MGKVAFIFPGQGSQEVGMGRDVASAVAAARQVFDEADAALGESLSRLCFEGPEDELNLTANTQPAVLTTSIALFRALDASCDMVAGHSLGEYSAYVAAGALDFGDAVRLVRRRGQYMQEAVPVGAGAMAAVLRADLETVNRICEETAGVVEAVNYNCPGQVVIAGEAVAVELASAKFKEAGARAQSLPVSAPFHSSLMKPAEERLRPDLEATAFQDPSVPTYINVDAVSVTSGGAARDGLARQVSRPVRWEESIRAMIAAGVTLFVEVGPGKVLTKLMRRIDPDVGRLSVQSPADFDAAREAIAEAHKSS